MVKVTRTGRVVWFLLVLMLIFGWVITVNAQQTSFTESFDDPNLPGWEHTPNAQVVDGVLRLEEGGYAFHPGEWKDFVLSVQTKRSGEHELIVIFQGGAGYSYIVVLGPTFVLIQRETEGQLLELNAAHDFELPEGEWFDLSIRSVEGEILVLINDLPMLDAVDPDPLSPGGIGFEALPGTTAEFDNLEVVQEGPTEAAGSQEPPESTEADEPTPAEIVSSGELAWVRTGGPLGGLGYDVRMVPENPDHLYVTDAFAGVFISTDGGKNWFPSNQGIESVGGMTGDAIPVFCLTIDPTNSDIIWIGTQGVRGIYRSEDGGQTWERRESGVVEYDGITFRGFTIDPADNQVVYAAAELSSWAWANQGLNGREFDLVKGVVYKTTDSGLHWTAVWRGDNLARYIWIDPRDTDVLYVSTGIFDREAANSDPDTGAPGGVGLIKSTDGGQTWQNINNGLDNLYVGTLFMHPENPDILLAGAGNNQYFQDNGVYITIDGGQTWQQTLMNGGSTSVEISTSDPQIAYAGDQGAVYRSEDGGWTWEKVSGDEQGWGAPGVLAGFPIDFQVDPRDPDRIFANNYGGGNFLSEDGGVTWGVASTGYTGAQVRSVAVDPNDPAKVYAAGRSGLFVSADGGDHWQGLNYVPAKVLEWNAVAVFPDNPNYILAANNWMGSIISSSSAGTNWTEAPETLLGLGQGWRSFAIAPSDPQIVYAGSGAYTTASLFDEVLDAKGIYVSTDGGTTWNEANDSHTQLIQVSSLAVHPTDPLTVYAASPGDGLGKTTDGGQSWTKLTQGLPGSYTPMAVAVSPTEPDKVYLGLAPGGIYRSSDGGSTWTQSSAGLNPEARITSIIFSPNDSEEMYLSDKDSGVFQSTDGGKTWQVINDGFETRSVNQLAITTDGLHIYAGTEGGGVYRLDLNGQAPIAQPVEAETAEPQGEPQGEPPEEGAPGEPPEEHPPEGEEHPAEAAEPGTGADLEPSTPEAASEGGSSRLLVLVAVIAVVIIGGGLLFERLRSR